jgi:hypothetical protein
LSRQNQGVDLFPLAKLSQRRRWKLDLPQKVDGVRSVQATPLARLASLTNDTYGKKSRFSTGTMTWTRGGAGVGSARARGRRRRAWSGRSAPPVRATARPAGEHIPRPFQTHLQIYNVKMQIGYMCVRIRYPIYHGPSCCTIK